MYYEIKPIGEEKNILLAYYRRTNQLPSLAITKGSQITLPFILSVQTKSLCRAGLQQIELSSLFHFELEVSPVKLTSLGKWARDAFALVGGVKS